MKKTTYLLSVLCLAIQFGLAQENYTLIINGFDWGPGAQKVVLDWPEEVTDLDPADFMVSVERNSDCVDLPAEQARGTRNVVHAYPSDEDGNAEEAGIYVTIVLAVAPNDPLSSPIQYSRKEGCRGNNWLDYNLEIKYGRTGMMWNREKNRIRPLIDQFDLSGTFTHESVTLTYAAYIPEDVEGKKPLIIWLHGGGEGGTDPSIALIANRAANYASAEIQGIFGGAYVLAPQTPTRWMHGVSGNSTRGQEDDIYHRPLKALFDKFLSDHPNVDRNRIYIGGCSNGGYMSLKLILENPDYFAAGYISALAYFDEFVSDQEINSLKDIPIWFVHAKEDKTTVPDKTVVPLYNRLKKAGAPNVHFTYYDFVYDITGFFGGEDYRYNGHWSWIFCHANHCRKDLDGSYVTLNGKPTTIMEWLAAQRN